MSDYTTRSVDTRDEARAQIAAARENGIDPWDIYRGHLQIARAMHDLLTY